MQRNMPHEDDDGLASGEEAQSAETNDAGVPAESKQPGRINRFVRRTARLLVIAGVLFVAGWAAGYFVFQRPQAVESAAQIDQLTSEKTDLETQVAALQADVEALEPLEGENRVLEASLAEEILHVQVLSALKDVQSAQLDLALGEVDSARLSLSRTEQKLAELQELLPAGQQGVVDTMVQRLNLVLDGMDADAFAAQSDLEVLVNSLMQLENTLFITP